jgi:hypothetical protein
MNSKPSTAVLVFLLAFLLTPVAHAVCSLEQVRFGSSIRTVTKELALPAGMREPPVSAKESRQDLFVPGEEICPRDLEFKGTPVTFVFLYGELVEIQAMRFSVSPTLVVWAEAAYGIKKDKPRSFDGPEPNAQWVWDTGKAAIAYSITTANGEMIESFTIQSKKHSRNFQKYYMQQEKLLGQGRP